MSVRRGASGRVHYNYFRDYDPAVGRYAESDPIGLLGGVNTYSYAGQNPSARIDFYGIDYRKERCKELWKRIILKSNLLLNELRKYDPVEDGKGGHRMAWGSGTTKQGGHYREIRQLQRGIKNDITEYKSMCSNRGDWPGCPEYSEEMSNRKVPEPVIPDPFEGDPVFNPGVVPKQPTDLTAPTASILSLLAGLILAF